MLLYPPGVFRTEGDTDLLVETAAHAAGRLLAASRTTDVVDASVVILAVARGSAIMTGDRTDIKRLLDAAGERLDVIDV